MGVYRAQRRTEPVSSQTVSAHRGEVLEEGTYGGTKPSRQSSQGVKRSEQRENQILIVLLIVLSI